MIRIPRKFYDDHRARDLPTPEAQKETKRHVWIDPDDPAWDELVSDARFYADTFGPDTPGLRRSAKATLKAMGED